MLRHRQTRLAPASYPWKPFFGLLVLATCIYGQHPNYRPLNGKTFQEVLDRLFFRHEDTAKRCKYALTIRVLPPFEPEWQIDVRYSLDTGGGFSMTTLSAPLGAALNEYVAKGGDRTAVGKMAALVTARTVRFKADADVTQLWIRRFLGAMSLAAADESPLALGNELTVALDGTTYQMFYTDSSRYIELNLVGPSPSDVTANAKVAPLVMWILRLRQDSMFASATKGE